MVVTWPGLGLPWCLLVGLGLGVVDLVVQGAVCRSLILRVFLVYLG